MSINNEIQLCKSSVHKQRLSLKSDLSLHRTAIYPAELVMASDRTPFHKACVRCNLCKVHKSEPKKTLFILCMNVNLVVI